MTRVTTITCDKCGKTFGPDNLAEWQEAHTYKWRGGYGSAFEDDADIEVDFCSQCFYDLVGRYCRILSRRGG